MQKETTVLYLAFELSNKKWKLGFSNGEKMRYKTIAAGDLGAFREELAKARHKFELKTDTPIYSIYEAGRDGFWIHRWLTGKGINNIVVDSSSIEVSRRKRRAKTDQLDTESLLRCLMRFLGGDRRVFSVVKVPTVEQEDERRKEREISRIKKEYNAGKVRIESLLKLHGLTMPGKRKFRERLDELRDWDNQGIPQELKAEILRQLERMELADKQLKELEKQRVEALDTPKTKAQQLSAQLHQLKGIGVIGSSTLSYEFFGWRDFKNVRQVGACAGLTGTPYNSGDSTIEQGISKAGNGRVRALMIELAWGWQRWQPDSKLTHWFQDRYAAGNKRNRRVGIVALARKLLVALWKYLQLGEIPEGATLRNAA